MPETLATLRAGAKSAADKEFGNHITASEWNGYVNNGYSALWDLVVQSFGDHFVTSADFAVVGGIAASTYALPSDFYILLGLDKDPTSSSRYPVPKFNWHERNATRTISYRLMGSVLRLEPAETCGGNYRIWYTPGYTALVADADAISAYVDQWSEYIKIYAGIKGQAKEESDVTVLQGQLNALESRIKGIAAGARDASSGGTVSDVKGSSGGLDGVDPCWRNNG